MRKYARHGLYIFILLSLILHVGVWTGLRLSKPPQFLDNKKDKLDIVILDQSPAAPQLKQIVEQDKALNDEIDEKAKYLSEHNQRVVKETRAAETGDFKNSAGKGENKSQAKPVEAQKVAKASPTPKQSAAKKFAQKTKTDPNGTLPTMSDLSPSFDPTEKPKDETVSQGDGEQKSKTNDFLKDTPPSLETVLSTREFVYYSYYQRIRNQIRQYWEPSIREKVRRVFATGRTIASERDHITRVIIVLDREGNLIKVQIIGESGVKDLDDAAVEAFRAAAPFPNPPKGIVDKDGTIKINWDFVLEADNGALNDVFGDQQRFARQ
jgi:TonB family protein